MSLKFDYKIMKGFIMKKLTILFLTIFLCSCTKKQLITSGIATGTGLGSYTIFKSFMGQSGTGGDLQTIMNSAFEDDLRQVWRGNNKEILITPQQQVNVPSISSSECRKFEFTFEDQGTIKRGSGIACKDANKNWRMLGSEML